MLKLVALGEVIDDELITVFTVELPSVMDVLVIWIFPTEIPVPLATKYVLDPSPTVAVALANSPLRATNGFSDKSSVPSMLIVNEDQLS